MAIKEGLAQVIGSSMFGAIGGLTCFLSKELTREGIIDAIKNDTTMLQLVDLMAECISTCKQI